MAKLLTNLTNFADQVTQVSLPDGSTATLEFLFNGTTERWIMNVTYGTFTANGIGLCCYPNVLRQWMNILPFGVAIASSTQTDPVTVNDFASGRVLVFLLDQDDMQTIESTVFGGPQV